MKTIKTLSLALPMALAALALSQAPPSQTPPAQTPPAAAKPSGHRVRIWSEHRPPTPEETARINAHMDDYGRWQDAFRRDDLRRAEALANALTTLEPDDDLFVCALADVRFRQGRWDEAYAAIVPFVRPNAQARVLLRAALASIHRGERRAGVDAYCRRSLAEHLSPTRLRDALPTPGTPGAEELTALLALGMEADPNSGGDAWGRLYYGLALRLDPTNPLANVLLGGVEKHSGNWDLAARRYHDAMLRSDPETRKGIGRRLDELAAARAAALATPRKTPVAPAAPLKSSSTSP